MASPNTQELLDLESVRTLRHHFAEALDNKNWDGLRSLFNDDLSADYSAWGVPQPLNKEQTVAVLQQAFLRPDLVTQNTYSNFRIAVTGDQATCVSHLVGYHYIAGFEGGDELILHAEYIDGLRREGASWKFASITLKVFYTKGNLALLAGA